MKNFNAVRYIYPDAVFGMVDDNPQQITWIGQEYPIPTAEQIAAAIAAMEGAEAQEIIDKAAAKASAEAKLAALGLTVEEIAAL